jgi:putative phosphoesterase
MYRIAWARGGSRANLPEQQMLIGLISDTHGQLRSGVFDAFRDVELILHAGDIGPLDIITQLEAIAPVHAVLGNTDRWELVPRARETVEVELEGHRIVVVHGHAFGTPTPARLREGYPRANVIVYGHTHKPLIDERPDSLVVNPGAAGPARFNLKPSVALLTLHAGNTPGVELVPLSG